MPGRSANRATSTRVVRGYKFDRHAYTDPSFCYKAPAPASLTTTTDMLLAYCTRRWGRVPKGLYRACPALALGPGHDVVSVRPLLQALSRPDTDGELRKLAEELGDVKRQLGLGTEPAFSIVFTDKNGVTTDH